MQSMGSQRVGQDWVTEQQQQCLGFEVASLEKIPFLGIKFWKQGNFLWWWSKQNRKTYGNAKQTNKQTNKNAGRHTAAPSIPKWTSHCRSRHWLNEQKMLLTKILLFLLLNVPANLENLAVATGPEKVSFHSNPKERQCWRMLKLLHNCTRLTR